MEPTVSENTRPTLHELSQTGHQTLRQDIAQIAGELANLGYGFIRDPNIRKEIDQRVGESPFGLFKWASDKIRSLDNWVYKKGSMAARTLGETWENTAHEAKLKAENLAAKAITKTAARMAPLGELVILNALDMTGTIDRTVSRAGAFISDTTGEAVRFASRNTSRITETSFNIVEAVATGLENHHKTARLGKLARFAADILKEPRDMVREVHHYGNDLRKAASDIRKGLLNREEKREERAQYATDMATKLNADPDSFLKQ